MKIKDFKSHKVVRSAPPHQEKYPAYKPFLKKDFCGRCAYCNLQDTAITTPFEVDHFIPRAVFEHGRMDLETDYRNLIYSCKKCNNAKRNQFAGNIASKNPTNELFYDPTVVDYNVIFFRNHLGAIDSEDKKGKESIIRLKLYRPIHILEWLCEEINETANRLEIAICREKDALRKQKLESALNRINAQYRKYSHIFIAAYNDNSFSIADIEDD